jgi:transcriptional regulator with XRE-family HTH domain
MNRTELLSNPMYWTTELQLELYRQIEDYMKVNGLNKVQLAERLNCSKSYVSQLLNGEFDHKLSKFFELSLAIGKVPTFSFRDLGDLIEADKKSFSQDTVLSKDSHETYQLGMVDYFTAA